VSIPTERFQQIVRDQQLDELFQLKHPHLLNTTEPFVINFDPFTSLGLAPFVLILKTADFKS